MKRSELKSIVKECLLEILMEGVATKQQQHQSSRVLEASVPKPMRPSLDHISSNQRQTQKQQYAANANKTPQNRDMELAKSIVPNDPVMASIFADTASTTLREQVAADSGRSMPTQDTGVDPLSLFENSGNWASLAFSEQKVNRNRAQ